MNVRRIHLRNFRSARDVALELDPRLNVFIGDNGAGKTTILDALRIMLSWAHARLRSLSARGELIPEIDIHNEASYAGMELTCSLPEGQDSTLAWRLVQIKKGRKPELPADASDWGVTSLGRLNRWSNTMRETIGTSHETCDLPLFVCYRVNRAVLDIPLRIKKPHSFRLLDAYDDALSGGTHFRTFFEWYRNREDIENEQYRSARESSQAKFDFAKDRQLEAVRSAILAFLPGFSAISVKRNPLRMQITKEGKPILVDQMSDGEKCLFAMIGDLARRLAMANPSMENPLLGTGIVLIDEIELHLHPAWQRRVVPRLLGTFPKCQFIVTTHSPQVLGEVGHEHVRKLSVEAERGLVSSIPEQSLGLDSAEVLEDLMDTDRRKREIQEKLSEIYSRIDRDEFEEARQQIAALRSELNGRIPDLVRAESLITMFEPEVQE